jgi:O-antigen/teichoic acid export membrane protein
MAQQRSFMHALKWAYTGNWGEKSLSSLFVFIIAGRLGPRDFGIASIALIYILFLQMFLDQGLAAALIQRRNLEPEHLDAVFWMDLALSAVLVLFSILLSRWWARVNHAPQVATLISVLSLSIVFEALSVVQTSYLRKEMDFRSLTIRNNIAVLISGVVGVGMAFTGFGVWALVGQQIARDGSAVALLWKLSPWRPRLEFSWRHLRELLGFSVPNFTASLANFADVQAGAIVLGFFFGPVAVGLYRIADRVVSGVVTMTMQSIQTVSFSEFSRVANRPEELRKSVLTCIRLTSTVAVPALAGVASVSYPLMATIGPKWTPASDVLKILCFVGMAMIFAYFTGPLLQALARTRELGILEWGRTALAAAVLIVAGLVVRHGSVDRQIMGIALSRFISGVFVITPFFLFILMKLCGVSFRDFVGAVTPSALASVYVVLSVYLFNITGAFAEGRPIYRLAADVTIGGIVGLAVLLALDSPLRRAIGGLLQRRLKYQTAS